jgi:Predicted permeases
MDAAHRGAKWKRRIMDLYFLFGLFVVIIAGFFQGLTSFGFALIAMPALSRIIPIQEAVPIVVILSLFTNFIIIKDCYKHINLKKIWLLIVASFIAAPFGTYSLIYINGNYLKLFTGVLIITVAIILLTGKKFVIKNEKLAYLPVGMLSGFLNGSISMSGPPVALFLSNQGANKNEFRANITFYAIFLNVFTIITYLYNGLLTRNVIVNTGWFTISMIIGVFIGIKTIHNLDDKLFKKIALLLIIVSGIVTITTSILKIIE